MISLPTYPVERILPHESNQTGWGLCENEHEDKERAMTPTKRIRPASITNNLPRGGEPDPPYSWAKQARRQSVDRHLLTVKELRPRVDKLTKTAAPARKKRA
jgi:hypothetical protein